MSYLCVVSGRQLTLLEPGSNASRDFDLNLWAQPTDDGSVHFSHKLSEHPEAAAIDGLGEKLLLSHDGDLIDLALQNYFSLLLRQGVLEEESRDVRLAYPAWMGPSTRHRWIEAARRAAFPLQDGVERGFVPVLARARAGSPPPPQGGFLVADACDEDLDLYAIRDQASDGHRTLTLTHYRRCRRVLSTYFQHRPSAAKSLVRDLLRETDEAWPILGLGEAATTLLQQVVPASRAIEGVTFHLDDASPSTGAPADTGHRDLELRLERRWQHWLDHGDARLLQLPLSANNAKGRADVLLTIPVNPPSHLSIGLYAGFSPDPLEGHELCRLNFRKPDFYTESGYVLVHVHLTTSARGTFSAEFFQHGEKVSEKTRDFPAKEA